MGVLRANQCVPVAFVFKREVRLLPQQRKVRLLFIEVDYPMSRLSYGQKIFKIEKVYNRKPLQNPNNFPRQFEQQNNQYQNFGATQQQNYYMMQ